MIKINGKIIWQIMNPHKNSRELGENKNTPGIRVSRIGKDEKSEVSRQLAIDDLQVSHRRQLTHRAVFTVMGDSSASPSMEWYDRLAKMVLSISLLGISNYPIRIGLRSAGPYVSCTIDTSRSLRHCPEEHASQ